MYVRHERKLFFSHSRIPDLKSLITQPKTTLSIIPTAKPILASKETITSRPKMVALSPRVDCRVCFVPRFVSPQEQDSLPRLTSLLHRMPLMMQWLLTSLLRYPQSLAPL